jgi:MFS family permease
MAHLSWVVTAYVLASTATMPLYGKMADQYGRGR